MQLRENRKNNGGWSMIWQRIECNNETVRAEFEAMELKE